MAFIPSEAMLRNPAMPLLAVSFEETGSTTMFEIDGNVVPEPEPEPEKDDDSSGCVLQPAASLSLEWLLLLAPTLLLFRRRS